jgi:threonine/homoserine/homoserine lactone efflux protein
MLATASGARFGLRRSWPLILGIAAGLGTLAAASAAGLAALLATAPTLRLGLKLVGSAYLVWLALQIARQAAPRLDTSVSPTMGTPANSPARVQGCSREQTPIGFATGVGLLWTNPKAWTMTLGAAASFGVLSPDPVRLAGLMGGTFAVAALLSLIR